jgi:hypothetical protein
MSKLCSLKINTKTAKFLPYRYEKHSDLTRSNPTFIGPIFEDEVTTFLQDSIAKWREHLLQQGESYLTTTQEGVKELAIFKETRKAIRKYLQDRALGTSPEKIDQAFSSIASHVRCKQYKEANEEYFKLVIGNATIQPTGIYSIGIHARPIHNALKRQAEKHHCFDSERSKKIILAAKRIITFYQKMHPTDPSR